MYVGLVQRCLQPEVSVANCHLPWGGQKGLPPLPASFYPLWGPVPDPAMTTVEGEGDPVRLHVTTNAERREIALTMADLAVAIGDK